LCQRTVNKQMLSIIYNTLLCSVFYRIDRRACSDRSWIPNSRTFCFVEPTGLGTRTKRSQVHHCQQKADVQICRPRCHVRLLCSAAPFKRV